MRGISRWTAVVWLTLAVSADVTMAQAASQPPTAEEATKFVDDAGQKLLKLWIDAGRADWVKSTYITDDTEVLAAQANEKAITAGVEYAKQATRFDGIQVPDVTARKLKLLKLALTVATPSDPAEAAELTRVSAAMEGMYGKGKYCPHKRPVPGPRGDHQDHGVLSATRRSSSTSGRAGTRLLRRSSRSSSAMSSSPTKARSELGFRDTGAMWRSKYDMPPDAFAKEARPALGAGPPAVRLAARLRALRSCGRSTATSCRRTDRSRRTCSATCGRRHWDNIYPARRSEGGRPGLRPDPDPEGA